MLPTIASDRSMRKGFCLGVNRTFARDHSPKGTIAWFFCYIWPPSLIKGSVACFFRNHRYDFVNRFISRNDNDFKPPRLDRRFFFESCYCHLFRSQHNDLCFQKFI